MSTEYSKQISVMGSLVFSSPLYFSVFLMRFSFGLVVFTLSIYLPRLQFSNFIVGIIAAAYPISETIFGPMFGILSDRFGRKRWIYYGLSISTSVLLAFTLSTNIQYLIIMHAIQGVAAAMIVVSSLAMVTDVSSISNRGREMGIYDFANLGGYAMGFLVAGLLTQTHSLVTPFYLGAGLAAAGAVVAYLKIKESEGQDRHSALSPIQTMRVLLRDRRALAMFPIWLSVTTFIGMVLTFGAPRGPSPLVSSFLLAIVVLVLAFTQPLFGHLSDKYGRDRLMMLGMLSLIGVFVTLMAMFRWHLHWILVAPFLAIFGVGVFAFGPAGLASLGDLAPERGRGTTMGVYSVVISFGTIVGPLLGGFFLDQYGVLSLLYVGFVILVIALGLAIIIAGPSLANRKIQYGKQ